MTEERMTTFLCSLLLHGVATWTWNLRVSQAVLLATCLCGVSKSGIDTFQLHAEHGQRMSATVSCSGVRDKLEESPYGCPKIKDKNVSIDYDEEQNWGCAQLRGQPWHMAWGSSAQGVELHLAGPKTLIPWELQHSSAEWTYCASAWVTSSPPPVWQPD